MSLAFDATFYQTTRPDVFNAFIATQGSTGLTWAAFAEQHYNTFGWVEGSDPNANFDTSYYLAQNTDVAAAGVNPFQHFLSFGSAEGRFPTSSASTAGFVEATYLAANADVQAAVTAGTFASGYQHWILNGQFESRSGAPTADTGTGGTAGAFTALTDNLTGTAGNDVFDASFTILNGNTFNTLNNADQVNGGAGTDTVNFSSVGAAAVIVSPASLTSIEILNVETVGAGGATVNVVNADSLTTIGASNMASAVTINNSATVIGTINITNNNGFGVDINHQTAATAGTSDAATFNLDGVSAATISVDGGSATASGFETINVASGGSIANVITNLNSVGNSWTTLNASGAQNLTITNAVATTVTTFNASAATGNTTLVAGNATGNVTYTGGTGNDSFSLAAAAGALTTSDTLNGGDGTDTLIVDDGDVTGITAANAFTTITNFENLNIATALAAAADVRVDRVQTGLAAVDVAAATAGTA